MCCRARTVEGVGSWGLGEEEEDRCLMDGACGHDMAARWRRVFSANHDQMTRQGGGMIDSEESVNSQEWGIEEAAATRAAPVTIAAHVCLSNR